MNDENAERLISELSDLNLNIESLKNDLNERFKNLGVEVAGIHFEMEKIFNNILTEFQK